MERSDPAYMPLRSEIVMTLPSGICVMGGSSYCFLQETCIKIVSITMKMDDDLIFKDFIFLK